MNYHDLFTTSQNDLGTADVIAYLDVLDRETRRNIVDGCPTVGHRSVDYRQALQSSRLNAEGVKPERILKEVAEMTAGLPLWNHPGTMLNVIPPVNLPAAAAGAFCDILNANFSQGHYSGNLALAERKVVKYLSDLVGWDWEQTDGLFTFGGKGTSLYALKCALNRACPQGKETGYGRKFFFLSSQKGHPCHAEVAEWLGIGKRSCIRVPTEKDGKIRTEEAERLIRENMDGGDTFLGFILSGGSTVEFEVDDIGSVRELTQRVRAQYGLPYTPWIHVDAVVGWPWLFYNEYDFEKNTLGLTDRAKEKIRSLNADIRGVVCADSFGADFHKTGFCSYISSLFMCRSRTELQNVSNHKDGARKEECAAQDELDAFSPFEYSLELSRSAKGAVTALVALETMGINGYRRLIADMMTTVVDIRERLRNLPFVELLNPDARGFATLFVIKPPEYERLSLDALLVLPLADTEKIKQYNVRFGNYVKELVESNRVGINFTATDAFAVNNTNVYLGMMKMYPLSVLGNQETNRCFIQEIRRLKEQFDQMDQHSISDHSAKDMVYR